MCLKPLSHTERAAALVKESELVRSSFCWKLCLLPFQRAQSSPPVQLRCRVLSPVLFSTLLSSFHCLLLFDSQRSSHLSLALSGPGLVSPSTPFERAESARDGPDCAILRCAGASLGTYTFITFFGYFFQYLAFSGERSADSATALETACARIKHARSCGTAMKYGKAS